MATITCLSDEVISIILGNVNISIEDIINFASTCKHFRSMINDDNILWQNKLYQRWPNLKNIYDKRKCVGHINFKKEVEASIIRRKELWCYVKQMSELHYYKDDLSNSDMKDFNSLFHLDKRTHFMNHYFITDEIMNFVESSSRDINLTHEYYLKKLVPYLRQCHLKVIWQKFINSSDKQQLLEQAAIFVSQWYQPKKSLFYPYVTASLENIAQQVLECLKRKHPMHSIFSTPTELFSSWKYNNIDDNQWDSIEGKQIIDTLREVLFDEIGFSGTLFENPEITSKYILIDHVLERKIGNPISLAIIFEAVARRLGIRCDIISFPGHFFLSWKSKYNTTNSEDKECFYIDVLHRGSILSRNDCPKIRGAKKCPVENFNTYSKISAIEVMLRMINYLQKVHHYTETRSLLELQHLIEPDNVDTIMQLGHYYMQYQMDLSDLMIKLTEIQINCKNIRCAEIRRAEMVLDKFRKHTEIFVSCNKTNLVIKQRKEQRTKKMMFKIGMIVTCHNKVTSRSSSGVIIGWDEEYNPRVEMEWMQCRPLYNRPVLGPNTLSQPFYKVLCDEDIAYYAIEDALEKKSFPAPIKHKEIGRYFCKFEKDYYVPNEMLAKHYPCDLR
ncbi:F-box only protein 21 [Camponotus floridanus]|uniref:F-box only protein 21 n=1 Tax=Camponotus floridanus TaxID=104421 RepID=UPI000DC6C8A4|nr:F-box only protein 21 [Camponotus floridanus]